MAERPEYTREVAWFESRPAYQSGRLEWTARMKRLLYIAHRVPYPPDKGERVRAYHEIRALAEAFHVTLAALAHTRADETAARELTPWCEEILVERAGGLRGLVRGAWSLLTGGSVTTGYFRSRRLARRLREAEAFDVAVGYASSVLPYLLAAPAASRVMDLVDTDSAKWASYARCDRWPKRVLYRAEARGVRALERRALETCDAVLLASEAEVAALGMSDPKLRAVANGVDTEYFTPPEAEADGPPSLVFTGSMDYRPNVEAVTWFAKEAWPALREAVPELRFVIVGRDPAPAVRRLAETLGITVTGSVPDVRPYLASATAVVAPLGIARGVQNKVLEAMAMGRAVVASSGALEGLDVAVGEEALRADTPPEWRVAITGLLDDAARRRALGAAARGRVESDSSWPARMAPLVDLCRRLAAQEATAEAADASPRPLTPPVHGRADA